jgi:hypothetical protein
MDIEEKHIGEERVV